ncbi:MAG: LysR family transcriptional regulator [Cyanobacteria bacterium J069]|nr:MAG: LysR family transcriptional regulator [Cyanobacteria bacterium J069]
MDLPGDSAIKLSQLRALVAVAQHRSFSTAALEMGVSQSTISHAIATLEAELGVVLLHRGRHGAALSPTGEQVLVDAQQILERLDAICQTAYRARGVESGQVRIASVRSIATHLLPEAIAQFRDLFPNVRIVLSEFDHYNQVEQSVRTGQADLCITLLPCAADLETWELCRDEFVALLPPNTLAEEELLTWERLQNLPLIMPPTVAPHVHGRLVQAHLEQHQSPLQVAFEVKEDSTIISMVRRGLGTSIMARLTAEPIPPEIQVRSLPVPLERVMGVANLADGLLSPSVFAFLDRLKRRQGLKNAG